MKYIFLFLVLALGYEGYTHWSEIQPRYAEFSERFTAATAAAQNSKAQDSKPALPKGPIIIPGQVAPGVWPPPAPPAPAPGGAQPPALSARIAASQKQAIAKYPALTVAGSEMNSRFVYRYKRMLSEKDARLQDPAWPVQLADECNDAIAASKPKAKAPSPEKPRQANTLVAAEQVPTH